MMLASLIIAYKEDCKFLGHATFTGYVLPWTYDKLAQAEHSDTRPFMFYSISKPNLGPKN